MARYGDLALYRRLFAESKRYWRGLVGLALLALVATPLGLLVPLPVQATVDHVLGERPLPEWLTALVPDSLQATKRGLLVAFSGSVILVALFLQLHVLGTWLLEASMGGRLALALRAKVFRHLQRLSLSYHDAEGSAASSYRIQADAQAIQQIVASGLIPLLGAFVKVVVMFTVAARLDFEVTLVAVLVAPFVVVLVQLFRRRLRSRWTVVKEEESAAMSVVHEALAALRVVKAFGQEDREHDRYVERGFGTIRAELRAVLLESGFWLLVGLCVAAGTAFALYLGALHVEDGRLPLGHLLLVLAYLSQLYEPMKILGSKATGLQRALAGAERVFRVLDLVPEVHERPTARPLARARGDIAFHDVAFGYDTSRTILGGVDLVVPAGSRVGISGPSGSGKSTLLGMLPRFHDPSRGVVTLDGIDLRDLKLADLRRQFAIVLQEPTLFSATVRENIAYGRPDASDADIVRAAELAGAHDFILRLPKGYETEVGERGASLSGGERQRVSLARAFLKDAPILLLDEPTSSIDGATEASIFEALERLMQGRTTFIIAHRLSTIERCDLRVQVENGTVVVRRR